MKWFKDIIKILAKFQQHENTLDIEYIRDITDCLLQACANMQGDEKDKITKNHIFHTLKNKFFAGIDTQEPIQHAILHMIAYPDIQSKVQTENR